MSRLAHYVPHLFVVLPLAAGLFFGLLDAHPALWLYTRLALYALFAAAATVLAAGHLMLIGRSEDGRASVWLVAFAYSKVFLALALWTVAVLTGLAYHFEALVREVLPLLSHVLYGALGAAMAGTALSAAVFLVGYARGCLDYRIRPYPWGRRRR